MGCDTVRHAPKIVFVLCIMGNSMYILWIHDLVATCDHNNSTNLISIAKVISNMKKTNQIVLYNIKVILTYIEHLKIIWILV